MSSLRCYFFFRQITRIELYGLPIPEIFALNTHCAGVLGNPAGGVGDTRKGGASSEEAERDVPEVTECCGVLNSFQEKRLLRLAVNVLHSKL